MITKEEYLNAVDIVEKYHYQLGEIITKERKKSYSNLEIGDEIKCVRLHKQNLTCLTKNKIYTIIYVRYLGFVIRDDNGRKKFYKHGNNKFQKI